ncbi:MAG: hypothetical protein EBR82_54790 [Caulobacteraceae bacterium]|nr:hypothetical protein [Caulobacteraceae bacterium]
MQFGSAEWLIYCNNLEKERWGSSVTPKPSKKLLESDKVAYARWAYLQEIEQLRSIRDQRDKIMFNAGRFSAGARDDVAVAANRLFDVLMEEG